MLEFMRAKLHHLKVTDKDLSYMGSLGVDLELLKAVGMYPGERVEVYNVDNGQRFSTYLLAERPGSRKACLYGAAARMGEVGDRLIVVSYALIDQSELEGFRLRVGLLEDNHLVDLLEISPLEDVDLKLKEGA